MVTIPPVVAVVAARLVALLTLTFVRLIAPEVLEAIMVPACSARLSVMLPLPLAFRVIDAALGPPSVLLIVIVPLLPLEKLIELAV